MHLQGFAPNETKGLYLRRTTRLISRWRRQASTHDRHCMQTAIDCINSDLLVKTSLWIANTTNSDIDRNNFPGREMPRRIDQCCTSAIRLDALNLDFAYRHVFDFYFYNSSVAVSTCSDLNSGRHDHNRRFFKICQDPSRRSDDEKRAYVNQNGNLAKHTERQSHTS